jgi:hypothetical protein
VDAEIEQLVIGIVFQRKNDRFVASSRSLIA